MTDTPETVDDLLQRSTSTNVDLPEPDLPPIRMVEVDGLHVAYRDTGESATGETYLLVHGLGGSLANWEPVFAQVAARGRVVAPDLAGFGRTEAGADRTAVGDNVTMLEGFCAALGIDSAVVAGNSMGGMIAAMLAERSPHLVKRLVLIDPVLPFTVRSRPHWSVLAMFSLYLCGPVARGIIPRYATRVGLERMGADGVLQVVADPWRVPRWVVRRAIEETIEHAQHEHAVPTLVRAAQSIVLGVTKPGYRRLLASLTMPVRLVHGDTDRLVSVLAAREAAARHPQWDYREGMGVGHVPMFEAADWVAAQILES